MDGILGELFIGGMPYRIYLAPDKDAVHGDNGVSRQRSPIHPNEVSFRAGKSMTVTPQFPRLRQRKLHAWLVGIYAVALIHSGSGRRVNADGVDESTAYSMNKSL